MSAPFDMPGGTYVVVTRHPRGGREIAAFGGARLFEGKEVLDIGTGHGRLAFDVAPLARHVLGVDPSDEGIRAARERCRAEGLTNVDFVLGDARELRVGRSRFDLAIFSWSL